MSIRPAPEALVADLAIRLPGAIPVFRKHGIDFCCGGRRPLAEVCSEKGLDVGALVRELAEARPGGPEDDRDWSRESSLALVAHIVDRYHATLRAELPNLEALTAKVLSRHGGSDDRPLEAIATTFRSLAAELTEHLEVEEREVFPAILSGSAGAEALGDLVRDHEAAGSALARLRSLTHDFTPPEWACPTYRALFAGLERLEAEMHRHVHLENNVLFRRSAAAA